MPTRRAAFRIEFSSKRGKSTSIGRAVSFAIFLGRKLVISEKKFTSRQKTSLQRGRYLARVIETLELLREAALKKAKRARDRKKRQKLKELEAKKQKALALKNLQAAKDRAALKKIRAEARKEKKRRELREELEREREGGEVVEEKLSPKQKALVQRSIIEEREQLDFSKSKEEEAQTLKYAAIDLVTVTPYTPKADEYVKEQINKRITTDQGVRDLTILNLNLREQFWVEMTEKTIKQDAHDVFLMFLPHMYSFFESMKDECEDFILRLKFKMLKSGDEYEDMAISDFRTQVRTLDELDMLFFRTIARLVKSGRGSNYLAGLMTIYISGFTLEAS